MLVGANALRLDFYADAATLSDTLEAASERWDVTSRQRGDPPHRYQRVVLSEATEGSAVAAVPGATLSVGPFVPRRDWAGEPDDARTKFALIALTNPREGMEEEYEDWYWNQHFPDGLRLPGCFAGRRYLLAPGGLGIFHHLAIYLFDGDIDVTLDRLAQIIRTPEMPGSPAISPVVEDWYIQPHR